MDPVDGLAQQGGYREDGQLLGRAPLIQGDRIRHHHLFDGRVLDALNGRSRQDRVGAAREDPAGPLLPQGRHGLRDGSRRIDDIVHDDDILILHLSHNAHHLGLIGALPPLVDKGQWGPHPFRKGPRPLHATGIGSHHHPVPAPLLEIAEKHRGRKEVIHRDVEKTLDLPRVEIHGEDPIGPRHGDEVGHQLGRDRDPGLDLAILPGVSVVGNHGCDAVRRGAAQGIDHDEQLHQVVIHGRGGGLDHKDIGAPHILRDLDEDLSIRELRHLGQTGGDTQILGDLLCQLPVGVAREEK